MSLNLAKYFGDTIMKIERMNKGSWGKVRAFFDICTQEGLIVKGFKLIDGINGLFVGLPSEKGKDEEWRPTVFADKALMQNMLDLALAEYNQDPMDAEAPFPLDAPQVDASSHSAPAPIDEVMPEEVGSADSMASEPYSDEDLPF